jgi:thiopurine S-methyltransferase
MQEKSSVTRYWLDKWEKNDTLFHASEFNPFLVSHFGSKVLEPTTVFVPLCGKSSDMKWLIERGHKVVGVELSPIACEAFFVENKLNHRVKKEAQFTVYVSEQCTIFCGNFFDLTAEHLNGATVAYDRAALVALDGDTRKKYFEHLNSLLHPNFKAFLITLEYPQSQVIPPPFSVEEAEVIALAGAQASVELLDTKQVDRGQSGHPKLDAVKITQKAFWIVAPR